MATGDKKKAVMQSDIDPSTLSNDQTRVPSSSAVKSAMDALVQPPTSVALYDSNGTVYMAKGPSAYATITIALPKAPTAVSLSSVKAYFGGSWKDLTFDTFRMVGCSCIIKVTTSDTIPDGVYMTQGTVNFTYS